MGKRLKVYNTYSDESMKYIPRAPILSTKTNTTYRDRTRKEMISHALFKTF